MDLLVAYRGDPAGLNMAEYLTEGMTPDGGLFHGQYYDLLIIDTPVISADWLEQKYGHDGFVFLSKHAAESGVPALTCHSTGNFGQARFGGNDRQVAVPYPDLQKLYLQRLWGHKDDFGGFEVTIEATHHGPTSLSRPSIFIEVGTTERQWNDDVLCGKVAEMVFETMAARGRTYPFAVCLGGTHYSRKFTSMLVGGKYALGTVVPKHALGMLDAELFSHILDRNRGASAILLDEDGLGPNKQKVFGLLAGIGLEVIRI